MVVANLAVREARMVEIKPGYSRPARLVLVPEVFHHGQMLLLELLRESVLPLGALA